MREVIDENVDNWLSLQESKLESDLVDMTFRLRVKISGPKDPHIVDIMTNVRVIEGVAIVRQSSPIIRIKGGRDVLNIGIKYMSKTTNLEQMLHIVGKEIKKIDGVDIVMVLAVGGRSVRRKGGAPYIF